MNYTNSIHKKLNLHRKLASALLLFVAVSISGCSNPEAAQKPEQASGMLPILQVKQGPYMFSMYPQFETETNSRLKLDVRDSHGAFIHGARVVADLIAKDGHRQKTEFEENAQLEKYVAEIPLAHHEDYVISAHIELSDSPATKFTPRFTFHCCDPLPELIDDDASGDKEGGHSK
jgi:hypothetical protein